MTAKAQSPGPFSRLSRIGLSLGPKTSPRFQETRNNDEWYIPYNGPYEAPREEAHRQKERDSWGDPVDGEDSDDDTALTSRELQKLYEARHDPYAGNEGHMGQASGDADHVQGEKMVRRRAQSGVSGRTVSSNAIDPNRTSTGIQRRSTVTSSQKPPVPSYINIDVAGGVGETPKPQNRISGGGSSANRSSIGSIFTFGLPIRKSVPSPKSSLDNTANRFSRRFSRIGPSTLRIKPVENGVPASSNRRRSSSSGSHSLPREVTPRKHLPNLDTQRPAPLSDEDYYNSYYSTLISSPGGDGSTFLSKPLTPSNASVSTSNPSQHPYAYAFPPEEPQTAIPSSSKMIYHGDELPHLTFRSTDDVHLSNARAGQSSGVREVKSSASTPDLRLVGSSSRRAPTKLQAFPKGRDRWLSAETWCDALLFPRPRLKVHQDRMVTGSGRIVSPPGSPLILDSSGGWARKQGPGMASRVLVHSRSLVNLAKTADPAAVEREVTNRRALLASNALRPPRPKSFAQDDLALLTPTPTLAHVLEDGRILDDQRKEWQSQATQSFQNKRMRSISRARSKSLSAKGKRKEDLPPSSMEFLAARACLGNQAISPVVNTRGEPVSSGARSTATLSQTLHSHSNSLVKTLTKSSKSHSRTHSRTDSWGRSALKMAKSATCGLAGVDTLSVIGLDDAGLGIENASEKDSAKTQINADKGVSATATSSQSISPAPSRLGDVRVGIALSTPPLLDDLADSVQLSDHPYAQGGLYSYAPEDPRHQRGSDYAGPHPSKIAGGQPIHNLNVSDRHRLPPQAAFHPYARATSRNSYLDGRIITQSREDSDVPAPAKMWAQLSPGVVREILPSEIQYSPFMSEHGDDSSRNSRVIYDTVGVGEALAYAVHRKASKDSGLGTMEDQATAQNGGTIQHVVALPGPTKRSYRQPVLYDATRPTYLRDLHGLSNPSIGHTFASSPLEPPETSEFRLNDYSRANHARDASTSPGFTSDSSSPPHSPRSFGSPDDLEGYRDLFYRPSIKNQGQGTNDHKAAESSLLSWETILQTPRTGNALADRDRQPDEEFEQVATDRRDQDERINLTLPHTALIRRPTGTDLEFIFEELSQPGSGSSSIYPPEDSTNSAFHPSMNIPEDVGSSRASSPINGHEDVTEPYRVDFVESVSTPPANFSDRCGSSMGEISFADERTHPAIQTRTKSGLQPLSANTRTSYMTSSTGSRMSGLSDFPIPPPRIARMSLLSSYFEEAMSRSEASQTPTPPVPSNEFDRRLTFGESGDIDDLVAALSSHHSDSSHSY